MVGFRVLCPSGWLVPFQGQAERSARHGLQEEGRREWEHGGRRLFCLPWEQSRVDELAML